MATWDADAETTRPVDYRLAHDTFVTMFWRSSLLDHTVDWLRSQAYDVVELRIPELTVPRVQSATAPVALLGLPGERLPAGP